MTRRRGPEEPEEPEPPLFGLWTTPAEAKAAEDAHSAGKPPYHYLADFKIVNEEPPCEKPR